MRTIILVGVIVFALGSCKKKEAPKQRLSQKDIQKVMLEYNRQLNEKIDSELNAFASQSELEFKTSPMGVFYAAIVEKGGEPAKIGDAVSVKMDFFTLDSLKLHKVYENQMETFTVGKHELPALNQAGALMSVGDTYQLLINPHLGFGLDGDRNKIPPARPFVINITLLKVN